MVTFAGPGADMIFLPLRSASERTFTPRRTTNCSIWYWAFWPFSEMYIATPGFFRFAFIPSIVTSTDEESIWLVIRPETFGGPPISRMISTSIRCSLKNPRSCATNTGSDELTGNTPTFTLSCPHAGAATAAATAIAPNSLAIMVLPPKNPSTSRRAPRAPA